jgi:hypothetical protein
VLEAWGAWGPPGELQTVPSGELYIIQVNVELYLKGPAATANAATMTYGSGSYSMSVC